MQILVAILLSLSAGALETPPASIPLAENSHPTPAPPETLEQLCLRQMRSLPGTILESELVSACTKVQRIEGCQSREGVPIYHYERKGTNKNPKRIFAKALIHGDENLSGTVARAWMMRLEKIEPRNTWRVIPVANPDGWRLKTRTNGRGVDLNRNFPTEDWEKQALSYWKKRSKSDPRRYPGEGPASEVETQCLIKHFEEFKPEFLISVHTPLGVLDFDGPKVKNPPHFRPLPWIPLGNFPGSLGRFMWVGHKIPVLTIELKGNEDIDKLEAFDRLQDISGTVAIQADQLGKVTPKAKK
ncbi:MAG: M14 family zinc carboxypeptidase [Bdellovibrionales bacterium]